MLQLSVHQIILAILRNQAHRFRVPRRGGHRTTTWSPEQREKHSKEIFESLVPYVGSIVAKVGLEVGPGDNLDVCNQFLQAGCKRMYAVEKYSRIASESDGKIVAINSNIEGFIISEKIDFAYSNDVLEHVDDVLKTMESVYACLKPGGRFASSIDLRGHNVFNLPNRPLDFLSCPDWLWKLMFSHIATTNRVRGLELVAAAKKAGFAVVHALPLADASETYLAQIRPHFCARYRQLPEIDLRVLQLLLVLERLA